MANVLQRMQRDWDRRAGDDDLYWIYTVHGRQFKELDAYYEDGARHAVEMLSLGLPEWGQRPEGKTILEIGCAIGRLFPGFQRAGFNQIIGADVSPEMIKRGKKCCPVKSAQFYLVDGQRLEGIASNSIDYCFSYNVFQHLPRVSLLWRNLEEISRVLKPGGYFQVHYRGEYSFKQRYLRLLPSYLRRPARTLYRAATLKWLSGRPLFSDDMDPGDETTWELGIAVSQQRMVKELLRLGFKEVRVVRDAGYKDGRRFWAMGRKDSR